jgi:hypothetical protein
VNARDARDAGVARVAELLGAPASRCPQCHRLLLLAAEGTMLPGHYRPEAGHSWCPGSEQPAVTR